MREIKDPETRQHTVEIYIEKQKAKDGGQTHYARSRYVSAPEGQDGSLVLDRIDEEEAIDAFSENRPDRGLSPEQVAAGIKALKPYGGLITETTELATKIAEQMPKYKPSSVRVLLSEGKKPGQKFCKYWHGDGWCLPGSHLEGSREPLQSQLDSLKTSEVFKN